MKYITYVFLLLWSILRGWAFLPRSIVQFFKNGIRYRRVKSLPVYTGGIPGDKIHFLNTGNSDAILLESDGHFALVDAAEDSEYPAGRRSLAYPGWEAYVLDYIKRIAGGKLDFILGTHAHSDPIGGFDTLILDPDVHIGRAYLKPYDDARMRGHERSYWDNQIVHDQMEAALKERGVPLIEDIPGESFALENFTVTLYNRGHMPSGDENDNSIGALIEHDDRRAFLAGDINNISGAEHRLAGEIGPVDLLKAGHHGHNGSSTLAIAAGLRPETAVFANRGRPSPCVMGRFIFAGSARRLLSTGRFGGVMAVFLDEKIEYYAIHEFIKPLPPKEASS